MYKDGRLKKVSDLKLLFIFSPEKEDLDQVNQSEPAIHAILLFVQNHNDVLRGL
jgi:hypothetical protein